MDTLRIMSGIAFRGAFESVVLPAFARAHGVPVEIEWNPTNLLMKTIEQGGRADVVLVTDEAIDTLAARDLVEPASRVKLARALLGVAVKRGAAKPDIATAEAFRRTMLDARSVAYSQHGASGLYFADLIRRLGIADQVAPRATIIPSGFTAERLVTGEADVAVQQISELMAVEGVDVVGPFPAEYQAETPFSAALFQSCAHRSAAEAFLRQLATPDAMRAYREAGLTPAA
jgi:molybdate transport system substrate-binding protein